MNLTIKFKQFLKRPEFIVEQGGVTAIIYREIFMSIRGDAKLNQTDTEPIQTEQDTQKGSEKGSEKTRNRIVCEMKENPSVTINELAKMLSISDRAVSKHLKKLQEQGIITSVS